MQPVHHTKCWNSATKSVRCLDSFLGGLHVLGRTHHKRFTGRKRSKLRVLSMSGTQREYSRCDWQMAEWNLCCLHADEWRDPNHLLLLSGMHLQHMNIRPGCNVTVVIVVMTNCTHVPNLFARVGVLAMEHIAVGLGDSLVCKQMPWKAESFHCNWESSQTVTFD